jgi:hypothetical protein
MTTVNCRITSMDALRSGGQPYLTRPNSTSLHDSTGFAEDGDGNLSAAAKVPSDSLFLCVNEKFTVDFSQSDDANSMVCSGTLNSLASPTYLNQQGITCSDPVPSLEDPQCSLPTAESEHHLPQTHTCETSPCASVPFTRSFAKLREGIRLSSTKIRVHLNDRHKPYKALSVKGQFQHYYVDPLCFW